MLCMLLFAAPAGAGIYKWVAPDGSVIYSDKPRKGAEEVELEPLQTYTSPPLPRKGAQSGATDSESAEAFEGYDEFEIVSPQNDAAVRDNGGQVTVSMALSPALEEDHVISLFMDGRSLGKGGRSTSVTLRNVDRGTHILQAAVTDDSGKEVARTKSVTFHLLRASRKP